MNPAPALPIFLKQRHVELLLSLDKTRHLGSTAEALHMSQPAASKSLAQLENQLGYLLFDRTSTGTHPTSLGDIVIAYARNLSGSAGRVSAEIEAQITRHRYLFRIGVLPSTSIYIIPGLISRLLEQEPKLEITVHEGVLYELLDKLKTEELDCVIGRSTRQINSDRIEASFLYTDPITIVCGANNELAHQADIQLCDLMAHPWILPIKETVLGARVEEMFEWLNVQEPVRHIQSNALIANLTLINEHPWISVLPGVIAQHFERKGLIKRLPIDTKINFGDVQVMTRKEAVVSSQTRLVVATIKELFQRERQ